MITFIQKLMARRNFSSVDFVTLTTAMMIAALDGDVSADELKSFRAMAAACPGCTEKSFAKLWDDALYSAGYLLIQSKLLSEDDLVALFVKECEAFFVGEISGEISEERARAFEFLSDMAKADGDFSAVEQKAIRALESRVAARREELISSLCPRGAWH